MGDIEFSGYDHAGRLITLIPLTAALAPISTLISSFDANGNRIGEVRDGVMSTSLDDQRNRLLVQQKPGQAFCRPWGKQCYSVLPHNCQDIVTTILNHGGLSALPEEAGLSIIAPFRK